MMNYDITEREKDRLGTGNVIRGAYPSKHSRVKSVLLSLSNIEIHHQNYHGITNFTNLTTFTLYKILKDFIISVNIEIMNYWHYKDSGTKNCRLPKVARKIIWMDDFKACRAISLHSDFCKLN